MKRTVCVFALAALAGCAVKTDPTLDSAAPKAGSLGNGDFYFTCDDSVACAGYTQSNVAEKFPTAVAEGAVFHLKYEVASAAVTINDNVPGKGYTLSTVGTQYLSLGTDGFTGVKAGVGTIWVKDAAGHGIDFTTINIAKPDEIVVYDGAETTQSPSFQIAVGATAAYRTVARQSQAPLAGVFNSEFTPADTSIVTVEGRVNGTTTLRGMSAGSTIVHVSGAGLTKDLKIEVTGATQ